MEPSKEEARKATINSSYQALKSLAEELERLGPLLKSSTQKVNEAQVLLEKAQEIYEEVKNLDPVPIQSFESVKSLCVKSTLDLHTARDLENALKVKIANTKEQIRITKTNYENAIKEPQAQIIPFPGRD